MAARRLTFWQRARLFWRTVFDRQRLAALLLADWWVRLAALALAVAAWSYVQITTDLTSVALSVPVQFTLAENFIARALTTNGAPLPAITLSVLCSPGDRDALRSVDYAVKIDLVNEAENTIPSFQLKAGEHVLYVGPGESEGRYKIQAIEPERIRIEVDRSIRKNIPVTPVLAGTPAEGYEVTKTNVNPSAVMARGSARLLQDVLAIPTEPISIDGLSKPFQGKIKLAFGDVEFESIDQRSVDVVIGINTKPVRKEFAAVRINALMNPASDAGITLSPPTVSVTLQAHQEQMTALDPAAVAAYVDVRELSSGKFTLPVRVVPPAGSTLVKVAPEAVVVTVTSFIGQ